MADIDYSIVGIEKLVKVDGTVKNVEVSRLTAPGENFLSLVLKVDFEVEKNGQTKTFNTVAKRLPLGERKTIHFNSKVMTNEIKWYTEIVKLIKDFAEEHGISGIDFIPEYCGSRYSLDPEKTEADRDSFLLLENLIPQGFKNEDRYKGFDLNTTKAILKRLAIFHAIPLAMKSAKPELFKVLKEYLNNVMPEMPPPGSDPNKKNTFGPPPGTKSPEVLLLEKMIGFPECESYVDRLNKQMDKPRGPGSWIRKGTEPWATILHTDFWVNNIMINPGDGKEPLVKIVDYQVCTYGSYAQDLVFFLLTSVSNDVARAYMDDLLRFYYEEFTSVLTKANFDLELTYTAFLKEVQQVTIDSEFSHALFFSTVLFGEKGTGIDVALEEFNPFEQMTAMIEKMSQLHRDKLVLMTTECAYRNWI